MILVRLLKLRFLTEHAAMNDRNLKFAALGRQAVITSCLTIPWSQRDRLKVELWRIAPLLVCAPRKRALWVNSGLKHVEAGAKTSGRARIPYRSSDNRRYT